MRRLVLMLLAAVLCAALPAGAAQTACGGTAPLELVCSSTFVPEGSTITVTFTTAPTFVGLIEARFTQQGGFSRSLPCLQASIVTSPCTGTMTGEYVPGRTMTMRAEVFSYEGLTPSIGTWSVSAQG